MKVNSIGNKIYKNQLLKKGLEFAADNGSLFAAGTSLALSTIVRPISILSAPKTDKENKKVACAKSIASSAVGYCLMLGASVPIAKNVKKIGANPTKYLNKKTIKNLSEEGKTLTDSKPYQFATQLFKLGVGMIGAIPKSIMTAFLIPPIMNIVFDRKKQSTLDSDTAVKHSSQNNKTGQNPSFTGKLNPLAKGIGKVLDKQSIQDFSNKHKDSNFPMHIAALTDTVATLTFAHQTKHNEKIPQERKNPLIYNSLISTGLCIAGGYAVDKALDTPTEKFIKNFSEANKDSKKLGKYVEGIKIAKPTLIMGGIYYCIIPLISTFLADRIDKKKT